MLGGCYDSGNSTGHRHQKFMIGRTCVTWFVSAMVV